MRVPFWHPWVVSCLIGLCGLAACGESEAGDPASLAEPGMSARSPACDFGSMANDARKFFPGKGPSSQEAAVLGLLDSMREDCDAADGAAYTSHWYEVAAIVGDVLGAGTGGDTESGVDFLEASLGVLGPDGQTVIFDPCGDQEGCVPWEGHPALPDFASALSSPHGAWAVVSNGSDGVCSSFTAPCTSWNAGLMGDAWGVEPSVTWQAALGGRTSLLFGHPLEGPSPTGEALLDTELPAYQWLLIPDPPAFGSDETPAAVLEVGLCSTAEPTRIETMVQKGGTVLTEAVIDWCGDQIPSVVRAPASTWERVRAFLSPAPAPLVATVALRGPGGSASSFTDFYAIDVPNQASITLSAQPDDGTVGQPILGRDGDPLSVRTSTSSQDSPLENALVTVTVIGNGGLVPSGNDVSGAGLSCTDFVCTGHTGADHEPNPGTLDLSLVFSKPGQYSLCIEAGLPPLEFGEAVCTDKFNVRP